MSRTISPALCLAPGLAFLALGCASAPPAPAENAGAGAAAAPLPGSPQGAPVPRAANAGVPIQNPLLDDLEDGDNRIPEADGRGGYWFTYQDTEGSTIDPVGQFVPAQGGAGGSAFSARMQGTLAKAPITWVGMGFALTQPLSPYDLHSCQGLAFRAKRSADSIPNIRVKLGDVRTTPEGGQCQSCYNDFGADLSLTEEWSDYELPFSSLTQQPYWGEPQPSFESEAVYQIQWAVTQSGAHYDIQVDDVRLTGCAGAK